MKNYKVISNCRLCNSINLVNIINFKKLPLGNDYQKKRSNALISLKFPLIVKQCNDCGHFQLSISVNPNLLYKTNYTYLSGIGKTFIEHFNSYYKWISNKTKINKKSLVVDVGSNDGSCLINFKKKHIVCGIDPAKIPVKVANKKKIFTILSDFNKQAVNKIIKKFGKADLITSHNVLAHIENNNEVFDNIYNLLNKDGYFCFEVGYFFNVLKDNLFDTIYHEHLDYHHASPIVQFLFKKQFSILNISTNSIQGGTLRILCKKENTPKISKQSIKFVKNENKKIYFKKNFLSTWQDKIHKNILKLGSYVNSIENSKKIIGYGAPTKSSLLIKLSKLNSSKILYILEDNEFKVNRYLPDTGIKILSTKNLYNSKPDIIIIFAWNFTKDILKKLKNYDIKGCKIIIPLPNFKVISL